MLRSVKESPEGNDKPIFLAPLPVQRPHPPIWVAAFGPLALKQAADKLNVEKEVKRASATTKPKPVPKLRVVPVAKRQPIVEQPTVQEAEIQEKKPAQRRRRKSKYHRPRARKLETEE